MGAQQHPEDASQEGAAPHAQRRHWHLDRSINLGHILTTATLIGAILMWGGDMDKRITRNTIALQYIGTVNQAQDARMDDLTHRMRQKLDSMNDKLDRLLGAVSNLNGKVDSNQGKGAH